VNTAANKISRPCTTARPPPRTTTTHHRQRLRHRFVLRQGFVYAWVGWAPTSPPATPPHRELPHRHGERPARHRAHPHRVLRPELRRRHALHHPLSGSTAFKSYERSPPQDRGQAELRRRPSDSPARAAPRSPRGRSSGGPVVVRELPERPSRHPSATDICLAAGSRTTRSTSCATGPPSRR